jgi:hypothetical protein
LQRLLRVLRTPPMTNLLRKYMPFPQKAESDEM